MTKATAIDLSPKSKTAPTLAYQVAMPKPQSHLFEVSLTVSDWQEAKLDLKMPVWTPGSYLVREYARHVQDFAAKDHDGKVLNSYKVSKNHWRIETNNSNEITVSYRVFANELTVRTNHLDATHGYWNGAALFFFVPEYLDQPISVRVIPPYSDWRVSTSLPPVEDQSHTYWAADFDTLVDSPFEVGTQEVYDFEVRHKPHQLAIWGRGNADVKRIIKDTSKIIETEAEIFGGLPYDYYLFILHLSASGFGGLEHKNSCSLNYPRLGLRNPEKYNRFMQLVAHEFFHLWNVKRIRPRELETFDYEGENYTTSLWFCEGTTSYYDIVIPLRAKIYDSKTFLTNLSKDISRYLSTPGRRVQSLKESSFDAWIKLYRRDAYSDNSQISYYLKGEMVSLLLDLMIRANSNNRRSLDVIMQEIWQQFGKPEKGFTEEQLQGLIEKNAQADLSDFWHRYLHNTAEIPFDQYLEPFGLRLKAIPDEQNTPDTGINLVDENGRTTVKSVVAESPGAVAGIDAGDEILAVDNLRVTAQNWAERLQDYRAGDTIKVTVFAQDELKTYEVQLASSLPSRYEIVRLKGASEVQQQNLAGWLGQSSSDLSFD